MSSAESTSSDHAEPSKDAQALKKEQDENDEAEKNFQPRSIKFWLVMIGMYLSIFLVALDRLIIATAIPKITDEFHSIEDIAWYGSAYMLTAAIFEPLFGRIYQLYSTKTVFLVSIIVFEVGSAVCGAAPSSVAFIIGRAIAGIGAAGIFCGGIMIIVPLVPLRKRPVFTSIFGIAFGISSILGPLVGGTFTDNEHLTWRWCFYINLPIGAATFFAVVLFFNLESQPQERLSVLSQLRRLDPLGLLFFVPSIVCLILALQWGGTTYPWSAPKIIALLVVFAVLLIAFLAVEVLAPTTAMVPMRVLLNRSVAGSLIFMFFLSGGMMAILYYLTIWFQAAQNQTALESGIRTLPMVLCLIIIGIAAAVSVQKFGYYVPPMLICPVLGGIGAGLLSTLRPDSGSNKWIGYQVMYGIGLGSGFQTSMIVPQTVLSKADVPLGMALMFFMQQLGGSVFISVGQNIFAGQLVKMLSDVADLNVGAIVNTGATALRTSVPPGEVETVVDAYSYALTRVFVLAAALSSCTLIGALLVEWKSIKKTKSKVSSVEDGKIAEEVEVKEETKTHS